MSAVAPLVGEAERILLDRGWRTRVPQRATPRDGITLEERRRLRHASYGEVERADVVIHVPAPPRFAGSKLHRELQHALSHGVPIALLVALHDRDRLGVGHPPADRVRELASETGATLIAALDELAERMDALRRVKGHGDP